MANVCSEEMAKYASEIHVPKVIEGAYHVIHISRRGGVSRTEAITRDSTGDRSKESAAILLAG